MSATMRASGSSVSRVDARDKVLGTALYPGDIDLPNQSWMKVLFARRPHARILSLDTSRAEAAPGVVAVFTAKDVPVNEYGLIMPDQPVLVPVREPVRFEGDQVALVVAETARQAEAALKLIEVEYEDLPVVTDPLEAMQPGSPLVHESRDSNVLHTYKIRRGDVEKAFAEADVIVESTYRTHAQEHAYLQPEAGLGYINADGKVEVVVAGQWMHEDRQQVAHALGLPEEEVVIRYAAVGGAFGGREDMSVQIILALAAWRLQQRGINRPVKIIWNREESIIGHHKRHPMMLKSKWGATRDGKVIAAQVDVTSDCGAYAYTSTKVLGNVTLMCLGPYEISNVHVDARTVYTNNAPRGAFRGFGAPQGHFAAELQMAKLAESLGMDPVELRMRNVLREGSILATRSRLPEGVTLPEVLQRCAQEAGWEQTEHGWRRPLRAGAEGVQVVTSKGSGKPTYITSLDASRRHVARGIGLACAFKNVGFSLGFPERNSATVELYGGAEIERAVVRNAGADVGQGAHTVICQMTAEALKLPLEKIELIFDSTARTGDSGSASASRMTFMAGNAVRGAAEKALQLWQDEERPAIATYEYTPRATTPYDPETGESDPNITYGYVAQAVEVEIDLETGHVHVTRVISVNDVGRAINRDMIEGQIEGAVVQAQGWAVLENLVEKDGRILTPHLSNYLIPTVLDAAPEIRSVILEVPDPQGPLGARGMAEMPFIPLAPALVAAVHDATGIWFDELPLLPERVYLQLKEQRGALAIAHARALEAADLT